MQPDETTAPPGAVAAVAELANTLAYQSIARNLQLAWDHATAEQRKDFVEGVLQWALRLLNTTGDMYRFASIAEQFYDNLEQHITEDQRRELAGTLQRRMMEMLTSKEDWYGKDIVREAMRSAAQRELAAVAREVSVDVLSGKKTP